MDAPVDKVHPPLRVLLPQKRLRHIRLFRDTHLVGRANQVCNGCLLYTSDAADE